MTAINREIYEALLAANVPTEKAVRAAEAIATASDGPRRLDRIEARLESFDLRLAKIEAELAVLRWMLATNITIAIGILWKLFK